MNKKENTGKHYIRNDIILVAVILLLVSAGALYLYVFRQSGDTVRVTVDGKEYGVFPLSENITRDIYTGENSEHHNRFVIKDGKAYMEYANCPDGICVKHSRIFRNSESIVCLPHRVVITVNSSKTADAPDAVA